MLWLCRALAQDAPKCLCISCPLQLGVLAEVGQQPAGPCVRAPAPFQQPLPLPPRPQATTQHGRAAILTMLENMDPMYREQFEDAVPAAPA